MPRNPILLCAPTDALREHVETVLTDAGYVATAVKSAPDAVASLRDAPYDLVIAEGLAVSGAIAGIRGAAGVPTPVLVVAAAGDVEARIAFLEAGADDVIASTFAPRELEARVEALLIRAGRVRPEDARHDIAATQMITFFSPKGGVGTTTLAVNSAVLLGSTAGQPGAIPARVLLIDLDLQFGQVATHLNLSPRFDLAGLAGDEPALNDPELAISYVSQHSSGVSVLAAPSNPEADFRVTVDQLERIVAILRPRFDVIVVDCGSRLDARTLWMLEQADTHVFVIFPEIAALRATSLLLGFLAETATLRARTHFVVNHVFPKELLKTRDIENLLGSKPVAEIPYTEVEMIRAVNEGVPVVMGRPTSSATQALHALVQAMLGIQAASAKAKSDRRGFLRRH
jgi:pilus assembly protein CpaE